MIKQLKRNQWDKIKIQKVQRPTNKSFYVNMPAAIAEALEMEKGEEFEWTIEDKNTLVLKRVNPLEIDVRINSK
jgi:antitoxin component of MazEF toxin-antitoxin module